MEYVLKSGVRQSTGVACLQEDQLMPSLEAIRLKRSWFAGSWLFRGYRGVNLRRKITGFPWSIRVSVSRSRRSRSARSIHDTKNWSGESVLLHFSKAPEKTMSPS